VIALNPQWILEKLGIEVDPELAELLTIFNMRLSNAPDKLVFIKRSLKKVLEDGPAGITRR